MKPARGSSRSRTGGARRHDDAFKWLPVRVTEARLDALIARGYLAADQREEASPFRRPFRHSSRTGSAVTSIRSFGKVCWLGQSIGSCNVVQNPSLKSERNVRRPAPPVTLANGTAERRASQIMLKAKAREAGGRITVGEDKAYDT